MNKLKNKFLIGISFFISSWNSNCLHPSMQTLQKKLEKVTSTPKRKIIFFSLLSLILTVIAGSIVYWNIYKKQIIHNELENAIREKTGGLYILKYDTLRLDEVAGDLSVANLRLVYDSSKYITRLKAGNAPPILLKIEIPSLTVSGVKTPRALLNKEIVGKNIHIKSPVIQIIYTNTGKDSSRNVPTKEVYDQVLGDLDMIKVDTVEISGAQIITRNIQTGKETLQLKNTTIRLSNVAVDSKSKADASRFLFARQFFFYSENISWPSADRLYHYSADSISLDSEKRSAYIKKFLIDPQLSEDAFVKSLPVQNDRFDFVLASIQVHHIDMQQLFKESLFVDSILIGSSSFKIYRDLSIPRDKKNRIGSYPHQALSKIPIPVQIKKMILSNSFVEYKEKNTRTNQAGKIQFHDIAATITNVANTDEAIRKNNVMTAEVATRFLNKASFKVTWLFYLEHPKGRFDVKGNLGSMLLKEINPVIQPMGPAKIEDGYINDLQFNLAGNDYGINGTVKVLYENLKITVLEKEKGSRKLEKKPLASFAANIVIKNSNPAGQKEEPRVINVEMERNTNRSIFYLIWKSLFKGIKETAGIKK